MLERSMQPLRRNILAMVFLTTILTISTIGTANTCPVSSTIRIAQGDWSSLNIQAQIHKIIWEQGYGCKVNLNSENHANQLELMIDGKVDYLIESWAFLDPTAWQNGLKNNKIVNLGINHNAKTGWYVPAHEDFIPTNIENLKKHLHQHQQKQQKTVPIYLGNKQWSSTESSLNLIRKLELGSYLEPVYFTDSTSMDQAISQAILYQEVFIFYHWEPSPITSIYAVRALKSTDPKSAFNHATYPIYLSASTDFVEQHPDTAKLISHWTISADQLKKLLRDQYANGWSNQQTARQFLRTQKNQWQQNWQLSQQASENIDRYLEQQD